MGCATRRKPPLDNMDTHLSLEKFDPLSIAREYVRLSRGRGRISPREYVQYGVYDPALSDDEKSCAHILERAGLPAPPTLAVIDTTDRIFPGTRTISTGRELRELLVSHCRAGMPVFAKRNQAVMSYGAFIVDAAEPDWMHLDGEGWMEYDACFGAFIGTEPYLLQPVQRNHPYLSRYTDRLATVRVYLLRTDTGVKLPFAVLKMASPEHVADAFWRPGNPCVRRRYREPDRSAPRGPGMHWGPRTTRRIQTPARGLSERHCPCGIASSGWCATVPTSSHPFDTSPWTSRS